MKLSALKILVTGGASDLGAAAAVYLAKKGSQVAIWDSKRGTDQAKEIGGKFYHYDIASEDSAKTAFDETMRAFKRIDVIINCAAFRSLSRVEIPEPDEIVENLVQILEINTKGTIFLSLLAAERMKLQAEVEGERGLIINVTRSFGLEGLGFSPDYIANSGSIGFLTECLARKFYYDSIRLTSLVPDLYTSSITDKSPEPKVAQMRFKPAVTKFSNEVGFTQKIQKIIEDRIVPGTIIPKQPKERIKKQPIY